MLPGHPSERLFAFRSLSRSLALAMPTLTMCGLIAAGTASLPAQKPALRIAADINAAPSLELTKRVGPAASLGSETLLGLYDREHGFEPWIFGTTGAPRSLRDVHFGPDSTTLIWHGVLGKKLLFTASTASNGRELWETDGTTLGTRMAVELVPGKGGTFITDAVVYASKMWFLTNARATGSELWTWDGTKATAIAPLASNLTSVKSLSAEQGKLWFTAGRTDRNSTWRAL